jgi:hypothetical protein
VIVAVAGFVRFDAVAHRDFAAGKLAEILLDLVLEVRLKPRAEKCTRHSECQHAVVIILETDRLDPCSEGLFVDA